MQQFRESSTAISLDNHGQATLIKILDTQQTINSLDNLQHVILWIIMEIQLLNNLGQATV